MFNKLKLRKEIKPKIVYGGLNMDKHWIIDKIENLAIKDKDTDIVVLTFNPHKTVLDEAFEVYKDITKVLPDHKIIAKLIDCELEVKNIDCLIEELQELKKEKQNEDLH